MVYLMLKLGSGSTEQLGQIVLPQKHQLPGIVDYGQIEGDFHMHTNRSDGLSSPEEMDETSYKMGLKYVLSSPVF